jgi:hypothetical protein
MPADEDDIEVGGPAVIGRVVYHKISKFNRAGGMAWRRYFWVGSKSYAWA